MRTSDDEDESGSQLTPYQSRLYTLLTNGLDRYSERTNHGASLKRFLLVPPIAAGAAGVAFLLMGMFYLALSPLERRLGTWMNAGLYLVAVLLLLLLYRIRPRSNEGYIVIREEKEWGRYLSLGRFEYYSDRFVPLFYGLVFGILFGFQVAIHYWTINHGGLSIRGDLRQCFLLTLDNLCHGIFLDTFQLYDINLAGPLQHSNLSATIFWFFRAAYDAIFILLLIEIWRRGHVDNLISDFPGKTADSYRIARWSEQQFADRNAWPQLFFDECFLLFLSAQFLRGDYINTRELVRQFPWLRFSSEVRELFIDSEGHALFTTAAAI